MTFKIKKMYDLQFSKESVKFLQKIKDKNFKERLLKPFFY